MSRKRSFQGCWTCRARKVRCGLEKPACLRCTKAGLECAGFDIKLGWASPLTIADNGSLVSLGEEDDKGDFQRRNVELVQFPKSMVYVTYKELNEKLDLIDGIADSAAKGRVGPFSVYKAEGGNFTSTIISLPTSERITEDPIKSVPKPILSRKNSNGPKALPLTQKESITVEETLTPVSVSSPPASSSKNIENDPTKHRYSNQAILSKSDNNSWVHPELMDYAKLTILAIKGPNYKFNEQNMLHILYPKFFPNIDSDDWLVDIRVTHKLFFVDSENNELRLKGLFKDLLSGLTSDLFGFNRVSFPNNYFDTLVIPYIKQLICEFICHDFSSWVSSDLHFRNDSESENDTPFNPVELKQNIKLAITYLTLGLSAFGKSKKTFDSKEGDEYDMDEYLKMSMELRKLSITIINYHLDEYDRSSIELEKLQDVTLEYENLLILSLLLQINLDNKFSVFENFELIFAIGDFVIKNQFKKVKLSNLSKFLINVFKIIYIFYESTQSVNLFNYSISEGDETVNYRDLNENYDLVSEDEEDEEEDDDDDDDEDEEMTVLPNGKRTAVQIRPTIQNLIISNQNDQKKDYTNEYTPLSFTISFNKRNMGGYDEASQEPTLEAPTAPPSKKHKPSRYIPKAPCGESVEVEAVYGMYGLPKSLIDLFHEIVHLTNHKNIFERRQVFPRNFPKICADIEDKLVRWNVHDHWDLDTVNNILHRCLDLGISAFHDALIVYFKRLIQGHLKNHDFGAQVARVLQCLQELIRLSTSNGINFRPSFWILVVCGSEATDPVSQRETEYVWTQMCRGGTEPNYWRGKQLLFEIWKRREVGEEYGFMDIVREWDIVLNLG